MTDLKTLVKNKSAILFDMDGTLVNTEPLHAKAAVMVLDSMGIKIDLENTIDQFYGMTDEVVLKTVCPHLTDKEIVAAIDEKNRHLIKIFKSLNQKDKDRYITPGLFDFLKYLRNEKKKCAVISASEDIVVAETLLCFDIHSMVDLHMGRNQTVLTKPHPDPYIEGMKRLQVHAQETLIFEDSPTGLKSAKQSLAEVIRVTAFMHETSGQIIEDEFRVIKNFHLG